VWWQSVRRRAACQRVRSQLTALGCPWAADLTDEEIERSAYLMGRACRQLGLTADDTAGAFRKLAQVLRESGDLTVTSEINCTGNPQACDE